MKRKRYLVFTILWMAVIFYFSSESGDISSMNNLFAVRILERIGFDSAFLRRMDINFWIRKAAHLTEYFILGMLLYRTYETYLYGGYAASASATGFLYALSDEFHQHFVSGRQPSFRDVLIDTSGVLLGVALLAALCLAGMRRRCISSHRVS